MPMMGKGAEEQQYFDRSAGTCTWTASNVVELFGLGVALALEVNTPVLLFHTPHWMLENVK